MSVFRKVFGLILSRDGSVSQTKLAAACFHFAIFVTACYITWHKKEFVFDMWALYATVAVGHSSYDKTLATIKDFKDKKLEMEAGGTETVTVTKTTPMQALEPAPETVAKTTPARARNRG